MKYRNRAIGRRRVCWAVDDNIMWVDLRPSRVARSRSNARPASGALAVTDTPRFCVVGGTSAYSKDGTGDVPKFKLPADLVAEIMARNKSPQTDLRVDGWKPSLLERLARMLGLA